MMKKAGNLVLPGAIRSVDRLPNEVLVEIFRYVQARTSRRKPWYAILRVCKHWSAVARASPILWRTVDLARNLDLALLRYSLTYSGDMVIDITFRTPESFAPILPILTPHMHRVRYLQLGTILHTNDYALASMLYHTMPALEELHMDFYSEGDDGEDELDPFDSEVQADEEGDPARHPFFWFPTAEQFPRLTHLSLGAYTVFSLLFPVISTLKSLKLDECTISGNLSLHDFLRHLARHPLLEELYLHRIDISPLAPGSGLRLPPTLRKFSLGNFPLHISGFLSSISPLPADVSVHLTKRSRFADPEFELEDPYSVIYALPQDRTVLPILSLVDTVIIRQSWWEAYNLIGTTPTGTVVGLTGHVPEEPLEPLDFLADAVDAFGEAPVTELRIEGPVEHEVLEEDWTRALPIFARLQRIAVTDARGDPDLDARVSLLRALRATPQGQDAGVLCSQLQFLELGTRHNEDDAWLAAEISACLAYRASRKTRLENLCIVLTRRDLRKKADQEFSERREMYSALLQPLVDVLRFEIGENLSPGEFDQVW